MIFINILNLSLDSSKIQVSVETEKGFNITSVKLWTNKNYKQSSYVDLSFKLKKVDNKEVFTITSRDVNVQDLNGIFFLEFTSNYESEECDNCGNNVIGVTANLSNIKESILNDILNLNACDTNIFENEECSTGASNIINKDVLLQALCDSLAFGYYTTAIDIYNGLLKLIGHNSKCKSCNFENIKLFKGVGYGILDNNLILT